MSTKYILYFIHKFFKLFISLIIFTFNINFSTAQFNDTLSLKYKNSQFLVISKSDEVEEWSFEDELEENQPKINSFKIHVSTGILRLNNSYLFNKLENFKSLPYNRFNSSTLSIKFYLKSFKINTDYLKIFLGLGLDKIKLNLGNNILEIRDDSLNFSRVNSTEVVKNNLNHHYITLPVNISWVPLPNKNPNLITQIEIVNQFLWYGKSNFRYLENRVKYSRNINSDFFNRKYYVSGSLKLIYKKIGAYFQSNLSPYSNAYPTMSNYCYGLTLCL